ncbi:MAG TPA: hypothetical protein VFB77_17420 [Acidimicrobiales bacterium]|nr:hypothetical protein [Acidimicrobiales bacterium]
MRRHTTAAVALGGALLGSMMVVGCGASEPTTSEAAVEDTADEVCALLRRWDNEFTERVNDTTGQITEDDDPTTANGILLSGFDDLITIAEAHQEEAAELRLPFTPERARLVAEVQEGTGSAIELLQAERDEIEDLPPIEVDDQGGALGSALLAVEGAVSAVEPRIELYDDEDLRNAFKDNPGCDHVVQSDRIVEQD